MAQAEETAAAAAAMPSAQPPPAGGQQGSGQAADSLVASLLQAMSSQRSERLGDASTNTEVSCCPQRAWAAWTVGALYSGHV